MYRGKTGLRSARRSPSALYSDTGILDDSCYYYTPIPSLAKYQANDKEIEYD
jgi:hypothetical protein